MKTTEIICVEVEFAHDQIVIKSSESTFSYYSNLTLAFQALEGVLAMYEWKRDGFNYTAVYRALKEKSSYVRRFSHQGVPFFTVRLHKVVVNPALNGFGIGATPA